MSRPAASALVLAVALAAVLPAGCGSDKGARAQFDRARAACATVVGMTLTQADAALQLEGAVVARTCITGGSPLGDADTCPGAPGPYTGPVCEVGFEWCAAGTSLCSGGPPGGCAYACVVRVVAAAPGEVTPASVVCASRFVSGQPLGPVSFRSCR